MKITDQPVPGDFCIVSQQGGAKLQLDEGDFKVVRIATEALAGDIERVAGLKPEFHVSGEVQGDYVIFIGTLGKNSIIDRLVKEKKLDVSPIESKWESFVITTVPNPVPGVGMGLVIAGSDRRGTAYGVFTLSRAIGVSAWNWWADVPPRRREAIYVRPEAHREGPPSVKYRGIFINDEDWGLKPWASQTFEPEAGDIGPKTYAKIFELLLRLKANYCWPAMHECTRAFNSFPKNKIVADDYAIVMGSSHCEQMLCTNTTEWPHDRHNDWNPVTNLPEVLEYWEKRVRENGKYESTWTVGMRGIHDGDMPGGGTQTEKRDRLEKIIGLQRDMLSRHVNPDASKVPQIFCPYKEVLDLYQDGLTLPDDVTIVWPDDNFGYARQLPNEHERMRSGGHGIYYHLSYWGRPHDYLWIESTSPALIWEEMTKAFELGVRNLWVVNVGDIKQTETGTTLFLDMAWNIHRYGPDVQRTFLRDFYTEQFGEQQGERIAGLKDEYFRLCSIRKPEHMGFNRVYRNTPVQDSGWSDEQAQQLLDRWKKLAQDASSLADALPADARDAYFQLVEYPACAAAAMAEKIILGEKARRSDGWDLVNQSESALAKIERLTERYNAQNNGKWHRMMDHRPRRLPVFDLPPTIPTQSTTIPTQAMPSRIEIDPARMIEVKDREGAGWRVIEGLGPRGHAMAVLPPRNTPTLTSPQAIAEQAPIAVYSVQSDKAGEVEVTIEALPTHRLTPEHEVLVAISIDEGSPVIVRFDQGEDDEQDLTWQTNVLRSAMFGKIRLQAPNRSYRLKLWAADRAVVVQHMTIEPLQ